MEYEKITISGKEYRLMPEEDYKPPTEQYRRARTGYESVMVGGRFWFSDVSGVAEDTIDGGDLDDATALYATGNYYNGEQLCDDNARADSILRRMRQWQALNDDVVDIYNPHTFKWLILYSCWGENIEILNISDAIDNHTVYFSTKKKQKKPLKFLGTILYGYTHNTADDLMSPKEININW